MTRLADGRFRRRKGSHDLLNGSRDWTIAPKNGFLQIYHIEAYHRFDDDHSKMSMEQLTWRTWTNNKEAQEIMINHIETEIFEIVS